jgi:hypothetical protein
LYGHLRYIFPVFGMFYQEKSGNPVSPLAVPHFLGFAPEARGKTGEGGNA